MSAKIYEFPARGRFAGNEHRGESQPSANVLPRVVKIAFGNAWYHEEAVDAERGDKK
jgi:hypothetical protein